MFTDSTIHATHPIYCELWNMTHMIIIHELGIRFSTNQQNGMTKGFWTLLPARIGISDSVGMYTYIYICYYATPPKTYLFVNSDLVTCKTNYLNLLCIWSGQYLDMCICFACIYIYIIIYISIYLYIYIDIDLTNIARLPFLDTSSWRFQALNTFLS